MQSGQSRLLPDMPVWPNKEAMDFSNSLKTCTGDKSDTDTDYDDDDPLWAPPHATVPSVGTTKSSSATTTPTWSSVSVLDPDMVNEQARLRGPFVTAHTAELSAAAAP
jgi:hypothetical protein